ncbi:MAG: Ig-like domain repeat protein [Treponema sp.]|jgi:hypothetical protein|nr:Ig-like domain repeat protein [Treponema sp.]
MCRNLTVKNGKYRTPGLILLVVGFFLFPNSLLRAGGKTDKIVTQTAEGREVWQKEFDLSDVKPGKYNVLVQVKDIAGNIAESGPFNIKIDPRAGLPVARVVYPEDGQILREDIKVVGVASGRFEVSRVMIRMDDREYGPVDDGVEYWTRTVRVNEYDEGKHTLYAQAFDTSGMPGPEFGVSFVIDRTPPMVELTSHKTGDLVSGNFTLAGRANDPNGIASVSWSSDGETWRSLPFKKKRGETEVKFSLAVRSRSLEDGPAVYLFRTVDNAGTGTIRPYLFFVDNNVPELEILAPGEDEDLFGRVYISGRIYDRVGLDRFYYEWAGEQADITLRPGDPFWTLPLNISAAQNRNTPLRVTAVDKSGNVTVVSRRLPDNRRIKAPSLIIDYPDAAGLRSLPPNGAIYGHIAPGFFPASLIVEGMVEYIDAKSAFRIGPEQIPQGRTTMRLWALSTDEVLGAPQTLQVNKLAVPAALPDGSVPQLDLTPSAITVDSPAPYSWVSAAVSLEGSVGFGASRLEYRLFPTDPWKPLALDSAQRFSAQIGLTDMEDGPVHLELRTIRGETENFPYYHPLNKFSGGPEIGFLFPTPDLGSVHGTVTVTGTVSYAVPLAELSYSLDGNNYQDLPFIAKYDKALFTFPCDFTALDAAGGSLTVRALDVSGVVVERTLPVSFDSSADLPVLIVNTPANDQVITSDFEISGIAFDDDAVSAVYWRILRPDQTNAPEFNKLSTSQSFQIAVPFRDVSDGENIIEMYAADMFEVNGETTRLTVKVSTAPPVTAVTFPLLDTYNRKAITITGTSSDANGIEEVRLSLDNGNSYQRAEGREDWTLNLNTESYTDGTYSVLLRTLDKYGIESFTNALINIDNTPPEISLGAPQDGDMAGTSLDVAGLAVSGLDVSGQAFDDVGLEKINIVMINVDDISRGMSWNANPAFVIQESLDVSQLPAGQYTLKLNALDFAGNETTVTRNVYISLDNSASELALINPMPGEVHTGPLVISGRVSGAVIPEQVTLLADGQHMTFAPVDRYGLFVYEFPYEQMVGREGMLVSASFTTPAGQQINSADHEIALSPYGPAIAVDSHKDGDVVTQRPWLSGRAWTFFTPEEEISLSKKEKKAYDVKDVQVSFDNGRSFEKAASSGEQWKIRIETGNLPAGPLPIMIRAEFADGKSAVRRIILAVDTQVPVVETVAPSEGSTHRDTVQVYGAANDDYAIDTVEISLRPGDKAGYAVPQFIQGLFFDANIMGATMWETGLGLSFFENNVKLQLQAGQTAPNRRFSGWVFGMKLLANIFYLPFDYFLGPDWSFFSMAFALGANFSYFTMEEGENYVFMGAVLGQFEFFRVDFSYIMPRWKYFKTFSLYAEPIFWFASSDISAGAIFRLALGARLSLF